MGKVNHYDRELKRQVLSKLRVDNASVKDVAAQHNLKPSTLYTWLYTAKVKARKAARDAKARRRAAASTVGFSAPTQPVISQRQLEMVEDTAKALHMGKLLHENTTKQIEELRTQIARIKFSCAVFHITDLILIAAAAAFWYAR